MRPLEATLEDGERVIVVAITSDTDKRGLFVGSALIVGQDRRITSIATAQLRVVGPAGDHWGDFLEVESP